MKKTRRIKRTLTKPKAFIVCRCGWTGFVYVARARFIGDKAHEAPRFSNFDKALNYAIIENRKEAKSRETV
ncbi:MAG: hypothetical protein GX457_17990 [Thermotogaceae bacterium]|nr:hypothetical protein [Thermotogaceae bacterium]